MAKKQPKLPDTLYVRREEDGDDIFYLAFTNIEDAIDGDGPTNVTTYSLVETEKLVKTVSLA